MTHTTLLTNNFEPGIARPARALEVSEQGSQRAFFAISALLFASSTTVTVHWCNSMSAMGEMPMPNGWTMSMAWMRMPGQTWPGAAMSFLGMGVELLFVELLIDGARTYVFYRRIRPTDPSHWFASTVWCTAQSFALPGGFIAIAGTAMAAYAPGVHSISQVIRYSSHAR